MGRGVVTDQPGVGGEVTYSVGVDAAGAITGTSATAAEFKAMKDADKVRLGILRWCTVLISER